MFCWTPLVLNTNHTIYEIFQLICSDFSVGFVIFADLLDLLADLQWVDVVAAVNFILARIGKRVDRHIVFVPFETEKREMIKLTERKKWHQKGDVRDPPDNPWVRPAADGAVQAHALFLPHGVGTRFDHKLWGVHQAVYVHALKVFLVFMDLKREAPKSQRTVKNSVMNFFRVKIHDAETTQSRVRHVFIGLAHAGIQFSLAWAGAVQWNISAGVQAWLFEYQLSQSNPTTPVGSCSTVSQETQSPEESLTQRLCGREYYSTRIIVALIILI